MKRRPREFSKTSSIFVGTLLFIIAFSNSQAFAAECGSIDFDDARLSGRIDTSKQTLVVTGTRPSGIGEISLIPVTHVAVPDYWIINVWGCPGAAASSDDQRFEVRLDYPPMGTSGILVQGKAVSRKLPRRIN